MRDLVETLLQPSPPPTPILGGPGAGKTTITLEALYDRRVAERFGSRRFFVRCEGAASREALVGEIARTVGIEPGSNLEDSLFHALETGPAVLVLDNTETPWEAATAAVEDLLSSLSSVDRLALVASIRGDQRPFGPPWRSSIRVGPLGLPAAREAFLAVAGERHRNDPGLDRLLEAVDLLPLAIVLLAHEAEAEPNLSGTWKRWQDKSTALLKRADGKGRLTNIEVSLEFSISGPRMTSEALRLLSIHSYLPDGIDHKDLDLLMPVEGEPAATVLRKVGLAFDHSLRLRVLAPIREYVRKRYPPTEEDLARVLDHFLSYAQAGKDIGDKGGAKAADRLVRELANITEIVSLGLDMSNPEPAIEAALGIGRLTYYTGWGSTIDLAKALSKAREGGVPKLIARCLRSLGNIAYYRSDHTNARSRFEEALLLCRSTGDKLGEGACLRNLAWIALAYTDFAEACKLNQQAMDIHRSLAHQTEEAFCVQFFGDIALRQLDYLTARAYYQRALPLFRRVGSIMGEANCLRGLGDIAREFLEDDLASEHYFAAVQLFRLAGDVLCEARCIQSLGDMAHRRSENDAAFAYFQEAASLYETFQDPLSIGWVHIRLARLAPAGRQERQNHLRAAREAWERIQRPDLIEKIREEFSEVL